jgi:hypothetical protein
MLSNLRLSKAMEQKAIASHAFTIYNKVIYVKNRDRFLLTSRSILNFRDSKLGYVLKAAPMLIADSSAHRNRHKGTIFF